MYNTALYLRLSEEDENTWESNSIKNQRDLLTDFCKNHRELSIRSLKYFIDDGYSGTNFQRPAVQDLIKQAIEGNINCILVKDFSRFGRNYIEVGTYIEKLFPSLGVRFISVNDLYDSKESAGKSPDMETMFRTLIYDLYSKDLSVKIISGKKTKFKKGEHINGHAPFGYVKSKANKNNWEIDEPASKTVKIIFQMSLEGLKISEIARKLNDKAVDTPLMHRKNNGTDFFLNCRKDTNSWTIANVSRILRDERYTGKLITNTKKRISVGCKKTISIPKDQWIIISEAHEAIVSEEIFQQVQNKLPNKQKKRRNRAVHFFENKLFCRFCNKALKYFNSYFACGSNCFKGPITENDIKELIFIILKQYFMLISDINSDLQIKIRHKQLQLKGLINKKTELYEDFVLNGISKKQYTETRDYYKMQINALEKEIFLLGQSDNTESEFVFTSEVLSLVKGIYVYNSECIEICFNYRGLK